jgi:hypothetical protein
MVPTCGGAWIVTKCSLGSPGRQLVTVHCQATHTQCAQGAPSRPGHAAPARESHDSLRPDGVLTSLGRASLMRTKVSGGAPLTGRRHSLPSQDASGTSAAKLLRARVWFASGRCEEARRPPLAQLSAQLRACSYPGSTATASAADPESGEGSLALYTAARVEPNTDLRLTWFPRATNATSLPRRQPSACGAGCWMGRGCGSPTAPVSQS